MKQKPASATLLALVLTGTFAAAQSQSWDLVVAGNDVSSFVVSPSYAQDGRVWASFTTSPVTQAWVGQSTDHGDTFALQSQVPNAILIRKLAVSPTFAQDQTLFQSTFVTGTLNEVLMKSTNGGATWMTLPPLGASILETIILSPNYANDQTLFIAFLFGGYTWRSTDGGQSWSHVIYSGGNMQGTDDVEFAADYVTSNVVFLFRPYGNFLVRSTDGGQIFTLPPVSCGFSIPHDIEAAPIGPGSLRYVFAGGDAAGAGPPNPNFFRSVDNGLNWTAAGAGIPPTASVNRIQTPPDFAQSGRVYVAASSGVYVSDDFGATFAPLGAVGLPSAPVLDLQLAGGSDGDLYARVRPNPFALGELYRLRLAGTGVVDLGNALAGSGGPPQLSAQSPFGMPQAFDVSLADGLPGTLGVQALGLTRIDAPLFGGLLVPDPQLLLLVATGGGGGATTTLAWPTSAAPGATIFTQAWLLDASGPAGFTASNALQLRRL